MRRQAAHRGNFYNEFKCDNEQNLWQMSLARKHENRIYRM